MVKPMAASSARHARRPPRPLASSPPSHHGRAHRRSWRTQNGRLHQRWGSACIGAPRPRGRVTPAPDLAMHFADTASPAASRRQRRSSFFRSRSSWDPCSSPPRQDEATAPRRRRPGSRPRSPCRQRHRRPRRRHRHLHRCRLLRPPLRNSTTPTPTTTEAKPRPRATVPHGRVAPGPAPRARPKIMVIMMENETYESVIGNASLPF